MQLPRLQARKLLNRSAEELFERLTGRFILVFDDGELNVDWKTTVISRLFWKYHVMYPGTALLTRHHLEPILNGGMVNSNSAVTLCERLYWDTYDHAMQAYGGDDVYTVSIDKQNPQAVEFEIQLQDRLKQLQAEVTNDYYNLGAGELGSYLSTMNVMDLTNITNHPAIKEMKRNLEYTYDSADAGQRFVKEFILKAEGMEKNNLIIAARAGLIKIAQAVQCIGPRGTVTHEDSTVYPEPILDGFAEGLRDIADFAKETSSAAKSMMMSKADLQDSEYFSRKLQFMTTYVDRVHHGDCGSDRYMYMTIHNERVLKNVVGKYYLNEHEGGSSGKKLDHVKRSDRHLIGRTLKMRAAINCDHPDPNGICTVCLGRISRSLPRGTNIGYATAAYLMQILSQSILSVKHSDNGSGAAPIELTKDNKPYLSMTSDKNSYLFRENLKNRLKKVVIRRADAPHLVEVMETRDVYDLNIMSFSSIETIELEVVTGHYTEPVFLGVHSGGRNASLSHDFLAYIKEQLWTEDAKSNYVIDMEKWDYSKPILSMPLKHYNMSDHAKEIADLIEATIKDMEKRDKNVTPDSFLIELYNLVNSKLDVNIQILDVIAYGITIVSANDHDYRLPKASMPRRGLGVLSTIMGNRSLGITLAYQGHNEVLTSAKTILYRNRPDNIFDAMVLPEALGMMPPN